MNKFKYTCIVTFIKYIVLRKPTRRDYVRHKKKSSLHQKCSITYMSIIASIIILGNKDQSFKNWISSVIK